ncbi:hypothetical protein ANO11243_033970 [Dothideomycetidae sp. 11243]|nr:hypothetical protein ANO11243_033970 [fungal sp. No.11243]
MALKISWHVLPASNKGRPSLLIKYDFHESGYDVFLTDFSRIWSEQLDYGSVLKKAEEFACDIDPSENAQQLKKLFEKVASALNGDDGTSFSVKPPDVHSVVKLELTSPLPAPLTDVHWVISLHERPAELYREHITFPLVEKLHGKRQEIDLLQQSIREKDHVISRLLDRLESSGTDLSTVFPGTSNVKISRKTSQRTQLSRYVKGLDPVDVSNWHPTTDGLQGLGDLSSLLEELEAASPLKNESIIPLVGFPEIAGQPVSPSSEARSLEVTKEEKAPRNIAQSDTDTESEDDFQIQQLPQRNNPNCSSPSRPSSHKVSLEQGDDSMAASDSEDVETRSRTQLSPASQTNHSSSPRSAKLKSRLGMIGGIKSNEASEALSGSPVERHLHADEKTVVEARMTDKTGSVSPAPAKRSKLGMVGGRTVKPAEVMSPANGSSDAQMTSHIKAQKSLNNNTKAEEKMPEHAPSKLSTPAEEDRGIPPESSQEKADRRRIDLKRQLATQSAAGSKKKRRF